MRHVQEIMQRATDAMQEIYKDANEKLQKEKDIVRRDQSDLKGHLQNLTDTDKYLNLIEDRNREIEKERAKEKGETEPSPYAAIKPEIKINQEYFEKTGIVPENELSEEIAWGLVTRAATNDNYPLVYNTRKAMKEKQIAAKNAGNKKEVKRWKKAQLPYKKMLNALSGAMKDETNAAYDPRNNNCMCINGQLMLLDLIEHLEVVPGFELIQSNTDGLIIWIPDTDEAFEMVDDICWEWEQRCSTDQCSILLELDNISEIYQKDVNNYLWVGIDGGVERIGAYVMALIQYLPSRYAVWIFI